MKVWLTDEENEKLCKLIEKSKLKKSDYIRKCMLGKNITVVDGLKEFTTELKRVGINLNQIARAVNYRQSLDIREEIKTIHEEVRVLWQSLSEYLRKVR